MRVNTSARDAFVDLRDRVENGEANNEEEKLYENIVGEEEDDGIVGEILDEDLEEPPELMAIGTSELGDNFVDTSARAGGADQTAPKIVRDMAEDGSLVLSTGWDEKMFYDHIAPEHELGEVDDVLESGAKIAWHENGERHTEIVGDEEALRETTEDIWSSAIEEAAEEEYKIHAQGNDVGTAVYIEAHSPQRGDLINTEQAIQSETDFDLSEIAEVNTDFEILEDYSPSEDGEAIRFSNSEDNRTEFYEAWKNKAPLSGLRFEKKDGDIVAYRDNKDKPYLKRRQKNT